MVSSAMTSGTCKVGSHGSQEMIMTHFHLGICPHNISNRLTAPCVQLLSYKVTSNLHANEANEANGMPGQ